MLKKLVLVLMFLFLLYMPAAAEPVDCFSEPFFSEYTMSDCAANSTILVISYAMNQHPVQVQTTQKISLKWLTLRWGTPRRLMSNPIIHYWKNSSGVPLRGKFDWALGFELNGEHGLDLLIAHKTYAFTPINWD